MRHTWEWRSAGSRIARRGASLIELLLVVGIMVALLAIFANMLTGSAGSSAGPMTGSGAPGTAGEGVLPRVRRQIQSFNLRNVQVGFFTWATDHNDQYPSTRNTPSMTSDTTHQVFKVLIEEGVIAGEQLISPNENDAGVTMGNVASFGPKNSSFALFDYDGDGWKRIRRWGSTNDSTTVLISDRWIDDPTIGKAITNLQADDGVPGYWNLTFNDGHAGTATKPEYPDGDNLFKTDAAFGDRDTKMAHD